MLAIGEPRWSNPRMHRMRRIRRRLWIACLLPVLLSHTVAASTSQDPNPAADGVLLSGRTELLRLVDLSASRLGLTIEYDAALLSSAIVTLRIDESISNHELWALTNQLLATRGFTTILTNQAAPRSSPADGPERPAGDRDVFSVVRIGDAAGLARVETTLPLKTVAGFASVLVSVRNRPLKEVVDAVKILLSKPGGAVQEVPSGNAIVVSDLKPKLQSILALIQAIDSDGEASQIVTVDAINLPAVNLAALVTAAVTSSSSMRPRPLLGKVTASPDNAAVVLVAPASEVPLWREMITQFDRPSTVHTKAYAPKSLGLQEVARLAEQTARDAGPRGSGDRWRIVEDSLSGMLIVTATPAEHQEIAALIERLNALPAEVRRPVRVFPIRNRSVSEIVDVLSKMLEAGVLDAEMTATIGGGVVGGPSGIKSDQLQRTDRTSEASVASSHGGPLSPTTAPGDPSAARINGSSSDRPGPSASPPPLILTADEGTNTLIAIGEPRKLDQLQELLRTLDVRQPQVMIEVLVVSLSENDTLDLGVELEKIEIHGDTVLTLASLFGLGAPGGAVSGRGFSGLILNPGDFRILIRALQTLNNGRSLNMPRVLVSNNQQANLDAVIQQPFVSTNASDTVATTSFGGFENAGTTITVKPQIAKGDHLILEYSVSLSAFVGESSDPGVPPPRQQNNLQSVVSVPDGFTVVVGGIEIETKADAVSQVPLLGSVPILGEAFKSRSRSSNRSRFFIFIRPTVLRQEGFEDLKYLSDVASQHAQVDDGFPEVMPRVIK